MKKLLVFLVLTAFFNVAYAADNATGTADEIKRKVQEKMDAIRKAGTGSGENVKEMQMKKGSQSASKPSVTDSQKKFAIGELAATNITGGIFEGAVIGAGCGLIGYGQSNNRNISPLINGAVSGVIAGAVLASALSITQNYTQKYYASDDYGINLIEWVTAGAAAGAGVGYFTYGSTKRMEAVTENTGYGIAAGAIVGMTFATIEFILPSNLRGTVGSGRAMSPVKAEMINLSLAVKY